MKTVGPDYKWRFPKIVDNHPELVEFLKTNPPYTEALAMRNLLMKRLAWDKITRENEDPNEPERTVIDPDKMKYEWERKREGFKIV